MKKARLSLTLALSLVAAPLASNADEGDLITHMGNLQMFMHKAALSLDAQNPELLYFYTHEIEETIEAVEETKKFKNYNIEALTRQTLIPEFEKFEGLVKARDMAGADMQYGKLLESCNSCHNAVERGYIKIKRVDSNPYLQDFSK